VAFRQTPTGPSGPAGLRVRQVLADAADDVVAGCLVGIVAGLGSFVFLESLSWATSQRLRAGWLLWLLPVAGFVLGTVNARIAGVAARGTNLVLDNIAETDAPSHSPSPSPSPSPPLRMTFLALIGSTITHLFGGSGGREGAAVQIAAGLTAPLRSLAPSLSKRRLAIGAVAGGFGSVFGVPFAGAVFGLEVQVAWRLRFRHALTAVSASFVGDAVARGLGLQHGHYAHVVITHTARVWISILVVGLTAGLCAAVFIEANHGLKRLLAAYVPLPGLRLAIGGVSVIVGVLVLDTRAYLGLSLPLIDIALAGGTVVTAAFALKLAFTVVTLGSGYPGGEVTPLFCIGACLGSVLADQFGVDPTLLAPVAFVAVFAAASHTPLACAVLAVEVFGWAVAAPALVACAVAGLVCGHRSVYGSQRQSDQRTMADIEQVRHDRFAKRLSMGN
jgi:H+/Cl- antiporter ClcA